MSGDGLRALTVRALPFYCLLPLLSRLVTAQDRYAAPINATIVRAPARDASSATKSASKALVEQSLAAVVHVYVKNSEGRNAFKYERPSSGVVIDPCGIVLTFYSLVAEAYEGGSAVAKRKVYAQAAGASPHELELVAHDVEHDLALLKVRGADKSLSLPYAELATAAHVRAGDACFVLSYHDGKEVASFAGVLALPQAPTTLRERKLEVGDFLITDAAIQLRSHGGPVLDGAGRVLGLASAEHVKRPVQEPTLEDVLAPSFGVVIPVDKLRKVFADELRALAPTSQSILKASGARDTKVPGSHAAVVEACSPSIVGVHGNDADSDDWGDDDPYATKRRSGIGSGVVVDATGLVLTNLHLLAGATSAKVVLEDGKSVPARLVDSKADLNLALLAAEMPSGKKLRALPLATSEGALLGETVIGLGKPRGGPSPTVSIGILSAKRGRGLLQADPNLGNDNGGGALVDSAGRLLGIIDGGAVDKREFAFLIRGDRAKVQNNLSTVVGIDRIRQAFSRLSDLTVASDAAPAGAVSTKARSTAVTAVIDKTAKGLLNIYVSMAARPASADDNPFATTEVETQVKSLGSGVVIDASGLAITNWHVVDDATNPDGSTILDHVVHARLRDGTLCGVEVLSISREDDLALLRLTVPEGRTIEAVDFGDSDALAIGETVVAIGNPEGMANTATSGIVSGKDRGIRIRGRWAKFEGLVETDAAINGGNSGGALLDLDARLVGINSAGGSGQETTGFAIPVNYVRSKLLKLLLSPEKLRSPYCGFAYEDNVEDNSENSAAPGKGEIRVTQVEAKGPAARAGIAVGDVIQKIDGHSLRWSIDLTMRLLEKERDLSARFTIRREGSTKDIEVPCYTAAAWACQRQLDAWLEAVPTSKNLEVVHTALTAMQRRYTNDATAEPALLPEGVVRVVEAFGETPVLRKGDLLLAAEFVSERRGGKLDRFETLRDVQDCVNRNSTYEGADFTFWVFREGKIEVLQVLAKRLFL